MITKLLFCDVVRHCLHTLGLVAARFERAKNVVLYGVVFSLCDIKYEIQNRAKYIEKYIKNYKKLKYLNIINKL